MTTQPGPTSCRWYLGGELRRLREAAGVSPRDAARELEVQPGTLSKIEGGKQLIKGMYIKLLAQLYEISADERERLLTLAEQAAQPDWFTTYGKFVPEWFRLFLGFEREARHVQSYESELVPGLLQTPAYVKAVALANKPDGTPAELQRSIDLRRDRQQRIRGTDPVHYHAIINEAVLHRTVGGVDVMQEQLEHLLDTSTLEHVVLQVLPFAAGAHPAMTAPFSILELELLSTVYLESGRGALYRHAEADLSRYQWMFQRLTQLALDPKKSSDLLATVKGHL